MNCITFCLQMLEEAVIKCLKICDEKEISSIAFPALGAGNLGYPAEVVAKVMTKTVQSYLQVNRETTCIKNVKFVIFMDITYKAFQTFLSMVSVGNESTSISLKTKAPNDVSDITSVAPATVTVDSLSSKINPPTVAAEDVKSVADIVPIKLCQGQLLKEKVIYVFE